MAELESLHSVRWERDEAGGGAAFVFVYRDETLVQQEHFFNSLDDLPEHIATVIRQDGGTQGERVF